MTVAELIQEMKTLPLDADVVAGPDELKVYGDKGYFKRVYVS
jgi:urocanate hydratase